MKMQQVSDSCFAVLSDKNRLCDANSGFINAGDGVVIDTQSDLAHARQLIELLSKVSAATPKRVVNTHEDADHVWGNQLFSEAEIIAHRSVPERMQEVAEPSESQKLMRAANRWLTGMLLKATHPGLLAAGRQLQEDYDFEGIELRLPTTLFDETYQLDLDGKQVHLIYVGPCHQVGDTIVHLPEEGVVYAGDVVFRECSPMGWTGTYQKWFQCLDMIEALNPAVVVPGHGPIGGLEGVRELRGYLQYVLDESKRCFESGLPSLEAAKRIDFGPYGNWAAPARLYMNVERAYRELQGDPPDKPWDIVKTFDAIYNVAKAKGIEIEF